MGLLWKTGSCKPTVYQQWLACFTSLRWDWLLTVSAPVGLKMVVGIEDRRTPQQLEWALPR